MKISTGRAETTEKIRKILRKRGITSHDLSTTSEYIANSTLHGAEETFGCRTSGKLALDDPATIESAAKKPRPSCTAPAHNTTGMVFQSRSRLQPVSQWTFQYHSYSQVPIFLHKEKSPNDHRLYCT